MEKKSVLMGAVPGVALAIFLVLAVPGSAFVSSQTAEAFPVHGYVTVSVMRDGNEIYHHEDHNVITVVGQDFIRGQIGATTGLGTNGANYIGLSTNTNDEDATDTCLSTTVAGTTSAEITTNGLARSQGDYAEVSTDQFTITETFTATGTHTDVQKAGLFTAAANGDTCAGSNDGIMMAENTFTSVSLANNDQLTITWTITLS
ncbi:hypothetical protein [Candidatus Nitrososphaera sp. FF02]|uniref:hypothetical protein n=1 Tax=Candidatus Nitrososphaera sp. FF02 TaxID=3398226 RepID=UPI0039EB2205